MKPTFDDLFEENQKLRAFAATAKQDLARLEAESRRYLEQYIRVEQQNTNLMNLYVASFRLHAATERADVIDAIKEIVINLIGSEEMAVLELDATRSRLELIASVGDVPAAHDTITKCVRNGEIFIAPDTGITACIPLKIGRNVIGAIAIFRLLAQKSGIEDLDRELFDLLATHAATALYRTSLLGVA